MSKKKPLVLYAVVCKNGDHKQHNRYEDCYVGHKKYAEEEQAFLDQAYKCGPHHIVKLQEVRSR